MSVLNELRVTKIPSRCFGDTIYINLVRCFTCVHAVFLHSSPYSVIRIRKSLSLHILSMHRRWIEPLCSNLDIGIIKPTFRAHYSLQPRVCTKPGGRYYCSIYYFDWFYYPNFNYLYNLDFFSPFFDEKFNF